MPSKPEASALEAPARQPGFQTRTAMRSDSSLCERLRPRPFLPPRLVAGTLLCVLAARFAPILVHARQPLALLSPLLWMLAALALGGCLWWVAKRQIGVGGGILALALYVSSPLAVSGEAGSFAALGVFAMVYTGVGVAHALQGPRRKWPPRIALMAALCVFTASVQPLACAAALVLAFAAMLYLAEEHRALVPVLLLLWAAAAAATWLGLKLLERFASLTLVLGSPQATLPGLLLNGGLVGALVAALALWAASRRSRYFGNTAPLLAAVLLFALTVVAGAQATRWAMTFVFLFVAGVIADGLELPSNKMWKLVVWLILAAQCAAILLGTG